MVWVAERWVDGSRRGQHVARVTEGGQVAHVRHVGSHGTCSSGEGQRLVVHALGELVEAVRRPFVSLGLTGHLAVACLDAFFLHGQWSVDLQREGHEETDVRLKFVPAGAFSTFFSSKNIQQGMTFINMVKRESLFEK